MGFYSWYRPVFKHVCITEFQIKFTSNWFITIANKNGLEYKTNVTYIDCARSLNGKSQKQTNRLTAIRLKFIYYIWRNDKGNMTFSSMEQCLFNRYMLIAQHHTYTADYGLMVCFETSTKDRTNWKTTFQNLFIINHQQQQQ